MCLYKLNIVLGIFIHIWIILIDITYNMLYNGIIVNEYRVLITIAGINSCD